MAVCKQLRWKGYYGKDWPDASAMMWSALTDGVPCNCLRTTRTWGPDDELCSPENCTPERSCFEASDRFPDTRS